MAVWQELVDYVVPSNTTSVVLDNFGTITKDDFVKVNVTSINAFNGTMNLHLTANSLNDHYLQIISGVGTSVSAFRGPDTRGGLIGQHTALNNVNQSFVNLKISQNGSLNTFSNYNIRSDSSLDTRFCYNTSVDTLSNITSFTLVSGRTNGIGANSRIQIYRLSAEKVADITVTSNTTQVDIENLDIKKGDEYLLVAQGTIDGDFSLGVNNDTNNSNYYRQLIRASGSTSSAVRVNDARFMQGNTTAPTLSYVHIKLSNIGAFTFQSYQLDLIGTSDIQLRNFFISSTAENITSIGQLNIFGGTIEQNSRFELYKLYEGGN